MEQKVAVGIVIRKDGTVPFDDGVDPAVRAHILAHLTDTGHVYHPVPNTAHVQIKSGPHLKKENING